MFDSEAPIVMPCGCYHDINRGIIHLCLEHLLDEEPDNPGHFDDRDDLPEEADRA